MEYGSFLSDIDTPGAVDVTLSNINCAIIDNLCLEELGDVETNAEDGYWDYVQENAVADAVPQVNTPVEDWKANSDISERIFIGQIDIMTY